MKRYILLSACLVTGISAFAQKGNVYGFIRNGHTFALQNVQTYIYQDSSIVGSAYTDSMGYYETNNVPAGTYNVKVVYPALRKAITITGVNVKTTRTRLDLQIDPPAADTTMNYTDVTPRIEETKTRRHKKVQ